MRRGSLLCFCGLALLVSSASTLASDWPRFRGPNGSGISPDREETPVRWSDSENVPWKVSLPGPGSSCPIVVGKRVFVTCWSGYGVDRGDPGDQKDLRRHVVCVDRETGKVSWSKEVEPYLPEDPYRGQFTQHGYASHTPVSDGERLYVYFGKTGALAFDFDGNKLWQTSVGTGSGMMGWGSASSPIVHENLLIITASAESNAVIALDKATGKEIWRQEADGFAGTWGSPIVVNAGGRHEIVLGVPYEIWALNPENGKLRWYCNAIDSNSMCASVIAQGNLVYAVGGMQGNSIAVRAGGKGDVTQSHVVWTGRDRGRISTPVLYEGRLYWVSGGVANCIDAKTGERVYQSRLGASPDSQDGGGRRGGGRGGFGRGQDYSSPVIADGKVYYVTRAGQVHVYKAGPEFEQLATNDFASDEGDFSATPAISNGQLLIRSTTHLYCVAKTGSEL